MTSTQTVNRVVVAVPLALLLAAAVGAYVYRHRAGGVPSSESPAYEQLTRRFYRGLAALQVGLIDDAKEQFTQATRAVPGEPASWANLGLAHMRLGEFDAAAVAIERAAALAPESADIQLLWGRLETSRGRHAESVARLQRAVDLSTRNLRARTALIEEIESGGEPGADDQAQRLLEEVVALEPGNLAMLVERAWLAAKRHDAALLDDSLRRLQPLAAAWPGEAGERFRTVQDDAKAARLPDAARSLAFLRNVLAPLPTFAEGRRRVTLSAELIADPITTFLRVPVPVGQPAAADRALTFVDAPIAGAHPLPFAGVAAFSLDGVQAPAIFATDGRSIRRLDRADDPTLTLPATSTAPALTPAASQLVPLDFNNDFKMDLLVVAAGRLTLLIQSADGIFRDDTDHAFRDPKDRPAHATDAWGVDLDMDGDLDVVVGSPSDPPVVLRNNGDGTWRATHPLPGVIGLRAFSWGDVDADGDPDIVLVDGRGTLQVLANQQASVFDRVSLPNQPDIVAVALGDVNGDQVLDVVTMDQTGTIRRASMAAGEWHQEPWGSWPAHRSSSLVPGAARLVLADLDNNGALDLLASAPGGSAVWLAGEDFSLHLLDSVVDADIAGVIDLDGDGQLDLVGLAAGEPVRLLGHGTRGYHSHVVRPRAQAAAGDQRINSFGIGGEVEVRSARLVQKQIITGTSVHVGLGSRTAVDVTRIVWPNGVPQAEFDPRVDQPLVAQQRLKGSCPWVFADDGKGMQFVTDFLWRSPLGLRINAQDTAGVTQTEDWVKIDASRLVARDGAYDVRITAELWETHYVDSVSLMVVDHPADTAVFVDERFARQAPALAVQSMRAPTPVARAWDQAGADVTGLVTRKDGRYVSTFARGQYQGVAEEHFVEIELGAPLEPGVPAWLLANGWIYPTDSSINVAIGQGGRVTPRGLSLEVQDARGRWVVVAPDLGFPAGKNKTILVDLSTVERAGIAGARRLRLRTNLEIYWDWIASADAGGQMPAKQVRIAPARADLRYRGFSETQTAGRDQPETPLYDRLANTAPRWRDLIGYYTRFGDVRPLLAGTDDRYVMMNAGDELRLSFPAPPAPPSGWTRDFVLIGDGWNKDGDFNTQFSKTVEPLPMHGRGYGASAGRALEADPVYQAHRDDWQTFHTRFVTPRTFLEGLGFDRPVTQP
ncbi:MAG: FG-GAP-like repeat-containing protein [Vicinamibacterales bacterium]